MYLLLSLKKQGYRIGYPQQQGIARPKIAKIMPTSCVVTDARSTRIPRHAA